MDSRTALTINLDRYQNVSVATIRLEDHPDDPEVGGYLHNGLLTQDARIVALGLYQEIGIRYHDQLTDLQLDTILAHTLHNVRSWFGWCEMHNGYHLGCSYNYTHSMINRRRRPPVPISISFDTENDLAWVRLPYGGNALAERARTIGIRPNGKVASTQY